MINKQNKNNGMEDGMSSMDAHSSSWMPGDQFDAPLSRARFNGNFAQQNQFEDYLDSGSDSSDSGTSSYSDWFEFGSGSGDSSDSSDSSYGGDYWDAKLLYRNIICTFVFVDNTYCFFI